MNIIVNGVEYVEKNKASSIFEGDFIPWEIGAVYLIRTVTMIQVGRVVAASKQWVMLEDADTGRFSDALKNWSVSEVEPFPDRIIGVSCGSIVDFVKGKETLRSQK